METFHRDEHEVKTILEYPKKSKERRKAFMLLRNSINFDLFINGEVRPYRQTTDQALSTFYPCIYCKGLFKKSYLYRHGKKCQSRNSETSCNKIQKNYVTHSQTLTACNMDTTNVISRLNVKKQVTI